MSTEKVKTSSSQVMELKDLISAPLIATIDADYISSRHYLKYLYEIAFEPASKATNETGNLRMLTFTYTRSDTSGDRLQKISIPILTLVPLPLLQIKEADFDFDIQVIDGFEQEQQSSFSIKDGKEIEPTNTPEDIPSGLKLRVSLAASTATSDSSKTNIHQGLTANMRVKVKMQQADMPGGLSNLLNLTANNVLIKEHKPKNRPLPK